MSVGTRFLFACLGLAALGAAGAGGRPVTLGLVVPPTEPDAASVRHGVQLAVAEANEAGTGPVRLAVRSDEGQWGTVGNDAVSLVFNGGVDALITPFDRISSHLILQVASRSRVPVATLCSDSSVTEAGVPWVVRVVPRNDKEAEALFAATQPTGRPAFHWWAVIPAGPRGRGIRRDLESAAHATGTPLDRIVRDGGLNSDASSLAHQIVHAAPDGVLLWLPPARAGAVAAALRDAGYHGRLAGPSTLDSQSFIAAAGAAATGVLVTEFQTGAHLSAWAKQFDQRFRQRYGAKPDANAAAAYDAAHVLIAVVKRAGDHPGFRQFPLTHPTAGATGALHFDSSGNRTDPLHVLTCQQGRFVPEPAKS